MSLINDALKKAARQRAQESDLLPPMPGGGSRPSRGSGGRPQNLVLVAGAAIALAVLSAVGTGIYMASRPEPKAAPAAIKPAAAPAPQVAPATAISVPAIQVPVAQAPVAKAPAPAPTRAPEQRPAAIVVERPAVVSAVTPAPTTTPLPVAAAPAPAPAPAPSPVPAVIASQSERVQNFIDGLHIAGVRYAQNGGKALVDGHIYRVNDTLDRALGVKLSKIDEDHLTFTDPSGATYVKTF